MYQKHDVNENPRKTQKADITKKLPFWATKVVMKATFLGSKRWVYLPQYLGFPHHFWVSWKSRNPVIASLLGSNAKILPTLEIYLNQDLKLRFQIEPCNT